MKTYKCYLLFLLVIFVGCSNKKQDIEKSIQLKNYLEAQTILNTLSKEEKEKPEIKELQTKINFGMLLNSINKLSQQNDFLSIDSLIDSNSNNYQTYSYLKDSLSLIKKSYAFKGADFYSSQGKFVQAYQSVIKYVSDNTLEESQKQIINRLKINVISGIWSGKMIAGKMKVQMRIDPVGTSSFTGRVLFEGMGILSEMYNGTFDGVNLSATYSIRVSNYRNVMEGITGVYNNGILTMTFPVVVTVTNSESDGGWGVYTTYESKIVRKDCVMSKTK